MGDAARQSRLADARARCRLRDRSIGDRQARQVLDLGCGVGRHALAYARHGVGSDGSGHGRIGAFRSSRAIDCWRDLEIKTRACRA